MSKTPYLYVGPSIITECTVSDIDVELPKCSKEGCDIIGKDAKGDFCHKCGSPIGKTTTKRKEAVIDCKQVAKDLGEKINPRYININREKNIQYVTWTPCDWKGRALEREVTWNVHTIHFYQQVTPEQIAEERKWLQEKYAPEISALVRRYGKVAISWTVTSEID